MDTERKVTVVREATLKQGEFLVKVENGYTYLRENPKELLMILHAQSIAIPEGKEQEIIHLLQWTLEERARWSVLAQNDRAGI